MSILSSAIAKFAESQLKSAWLRNGQRVTRTKTGRKTAVLQPPQGDAAGLAVKRVRTLFVMPSSRPRRREVQSTQVDSQLSSRLKPNFDDFERGRRHAVSQGRFVLPSARHGKQLVVIERMNALLQCRGRDVAVLVDGDLNQTLEAGCTIGGVWGRPARNGLRDDDRRRKAQRDVGRTVGRRIDDGCGLR